MFRFSIRDMLWLSVVVALVVVWRSEVTSQRAAWQAEKEAILKQREAELASERRLATLRALEARNIIPSGSFSSPQSPFFEPGRL